MPRAGQKQRPPDFKKPRSAGLIQSAWAFPVRGHLEPDDIRLTHRDGVEFGSAQGVRVEQREAL